MRKDIPKLILLSNTEHNVSQGEPSLILLSPNIKMEKEVFWKDIISKKSTGAGFWLWRSDNSRKKNKFLLVLQNIYAVILEYKILSQVAITSSS